jgi:hypothetical protein
MKPLRQVNAVDALSAAASKPAATDAPAEPEKKSEKPTPEKP